MPKVRKLKHHEQRLLRRTNFLQWQTDKLTPKYKDYVLKTISKFLLRDQTEFFKYQRIVNEINDTIKEIKALDDKDFKFFKQEQLELLQNKLYSMGILQSKTQELTRVTVDQICRRRLSFLMYKLNFAESVKLACIYISHGHVRIGPEVVTDPAYLVTRNLEDFITWVDQSKIKKTILKFNDEYDDYTAQN